MNHLFILRLRRNFHRLMRDFYRKCLFFRCATLPSLREPLRVPLRVPLREPLRGRSNNKECPNNYKYFHPLTIISRNPQTIKSSFNLRKVFGQRNLLIFPTVFVKTILYIFLDIFLLLKQKGRNTYYGHENCEKCHTMQEVRRHY
jgi:hypothetical protein